jgi:hypothetical protein
MTTPTVPYDWATAAIPADISAPPSGVRLSGYGLNDQFDHDEFNYLMNAMGQWVGHFSNTGLIFNGLTAAEDSGQVTAGVSFTVQDSGHPLELVQDVTSATDNVDVCGNGPNTVLLDDTGTVILLRDTGVIVVAAATATALSVGCGATHWAIIDGGTVKAYDYDGNLAWSYVHGATLTDVAVDADQVYIVGASGINADGTGTHRAIDIATGLEVWTQAWGATLNCVYATGATVLVGGNLGGGVYAAEITRDLGIIDRVIVLPSAVPGKRGLYTDGLRCYAMTSGGLYVFPYSTMTYTIGSAILSSGLMVVDDTFVYVKETSSASNVKVFTKSNTDMTYAQLTPQGGAAAIRSLYSSGRRVYIGYDMTGSRCMDIYKTTAQNKRFVAKADTAGEFLPTASLYCPENIQY